jgi:hypothetical protein
LVPFQRHATIWVALCFGTALALSGWNIAKKFRRRRWGVEDGFLFLGAAVFAAQLTVPEGVQGGTFTSFRLGIYLWLVLLGWLLLQERILGEVPFSGLLGFVFLVGGTMQPLDWVNHLKTFQPIVENLDEVAEEIPSHSQVWPIVLNPFGVDEDGTTLAPRNRHFSHVGLRALASKKDVASRITFQAEVPLFPVRYKTQPSVTFYLGGFSTHPEDFPIGDALAEFLREPRPSYLLIVGDPPGGITPHSPLAAFMRGLGDPEASASGPLGPVLLFKLEEETHTATVGAGE